MSDGSFRLKGKHPSPAVLVLLLVSQNVASQSLSEVISLLELEPLVPEGGYYRETFRYVQLPAEARTKPALKPVSLAIQIKT